HEEACRRLGAGGAGHHGEGRARADLQARPAPTGGRGGMDREVPPALGRTLRRVGQNCRGIETEGKGRWAQDERVIPPPERTARRWNGGPSVSWSSRGPSTPRRASCSRPGPPPSCSTGGGRGSGSACPSCPGGPLFVGGARPFSCPAPPPRSSRWIFSAGTLK